MGDQHSWEPRPYAGMTPLKLTSDMQGAEAIEPDRLPEGSEQVAPPTAADLEAYNAILQGRDRLFEATAKATNVLLTLENFDEAINTALGIILEAAGCDRIKVLENSFEATSALPSSATVIYEWARPGVLRQMAQLESRHTSHGGLETFLEYYFLEGDGFSGLLDEWVEPLRSAMAAFGVKSSCSVPIRVNGQWWGMLALNYCQEAIRTGPAEVAVLRTIADCIGSAIQRDRSQQERGQIARQRAEDLEAYNQVLQGRDRLFDATAKATNVLLTLDDFDMAINTALEIIAAGAGCDRIKVLENEFAGLSTVPAYCTVIYEWAGPGIIRQMTHVESRRISTADITSFMEQCFLPGDGFGGRLEDWDESLHDAFAAVQVQSTYAVPIWVNGQWWGILAVDYCRQVILNSPAEVAVLRTIADCIGSAIQRDRITREQQESAQRHAQELAKANHVLKKTVDLLATEPHLDCFLNHVMKALADQFDAPLIQYWEHPEPGDMAQGNRILIECSYG